MGVPLDASHTREEHEGGEIARYADAAGPELARALEDAVFAETLLYKPGPCTLYRRQVGAYVDPTHEEVDFTDWNGTPVGRGPGPVLRESIPPDARLPYSELAPLLEMGPRARRLLAAHPSTPEEALVTLASDPDESVQHAVLDRADVTDVSAHVRAVLAGSTFASPRRRIATRDDVTDAQLEAFSRDPSPYVRFAAISHPRRSPAWLERMADDPSQDVVWMVAGLASTPPEALARIAAREQLPPKVMKALCQNPSTPPASLEHLLCRADAHEQTLLAANPSLPSSAAMTLAKSKDFHVRIALAGSGVDAAALATLIDDDFELVRLALADNPRFTALLDLATDPYFQVRKRVAARPDAPPEVLDALAHDSELAVRRVVEERRRPGSSSTS
jgi:hypothetical protein